MTVATTGHEKGWEAGFGIGGFPLVIEPNQKADVVGTDPAAIGETTTGSFDESRRATKGEKKE